MSSTPADTDSPLMTAWNNYKKSEDYQSAKHSLKTWPDSIDGCFWDAFYAGWEEAIKEAETVKQLKGMVTIVEEYDAQEFNPECFGLWNCKDSFCEVAGECSEIALFSDEKVIAIIEEKDPDLLSGCVALVGEYDPNLKNCFGHCICTNFSDCKIYKECSLHHPDVKMTTNVVIVLEEGD